MSLSLNPRAIIDRCGSLSFKRGEDYYYKNKVEIQSNQQDYWEAVVNGAEAFYVTIQHSSIVKGGLETTCTCPKLSSISKECQHVAAVLIALYHQQNKSNINEEQILAEEFLTLFNKRPRKRTIGAQKHFETRMLMNLELICHAKPIDHRSTIIGIELAVDGEKITDIHAFLKSLKYQTAYQLNSNVTFHINTHCFKKIQERIIQELINIAEDKSVYGELGMLQSQFNLEESLLFLSPSAWERLFPMLRQSTFCSFVYDGQSYSSIEIFDGMLPLHFYFTHEQDGNIGLHIQGFEAIWILSDYQLVLVDGKR